MYRRNNFKRNNHHTFVKKPRRVAYTIQTSFLEATDWAALEENVALPIVHDISIRTGCRPEHIDWHICDAAGEIEITFTPFRTDIELLRKQLQTKYAEYTITTTYDTYAKDNEEVENAE